MNNTAVPVTVYTYTVAIDVQYSGSLPTESIFLLDRLRFLQQEQNGTIIFFRAAESVQNRHDVPVNGLAVVDY
jgi:hypothetical protein